jgi:hypothetical protein
MINDNPGVVVILAWRFKDEIIKKIPLFKGTIIIPLPKLEVIGCG